MFKYVFAFVFAGCLWLEAGMLPDYDIRCNSMLCHPAEITPNGYFYKAVPKKVHQIWFGDQSRLDRRKAGLWKDFSEKFGYEYVLWTEQDDDTVRSFMLPQNFELMMQMRQKGEYRVASDILRYELIKRFGGVYVDCDFSPPSDENGLIDLQNIVNFHGLTLMIEPYSRDIGTNAALFVANGFIVCPDDHPIINSLVDQVYGNTMYWYSKEGNFDVMFVAGSVFVNKVLTGTFGVVPCAYLKKLNMWERKKIE